VAALNLGIVRGKRKRVVRYASNKKEAREKLNQLRYQQQAGINLASETMTMATYLTRWLARPSRKNLAASTQKSYAEKIRLYIVPHIGSITLNRLTPADVQQMIEALSATHLAPRTVQYTVAILRAALNRAQKDGTISRNVATLVEMPKVRPYKAAFLTVEEAKSLLQAVAGHRLEPLYRIALSWGCAGERFSRSPGSLWI